MHVPVPRRDMEAAAAAAYEDLTRVTGVEPVTARWRSEVREAARRTGHFAVLTDAWALVLSLTNDS
ncbi:hypothetical protein E1267_30185 [Nonomuraea longispora]|uniref:Uncharacterized protein n=1 Tax=Nonomuraea longispora TaxID=1848320 RepID=A0A4R4N0B1_9ACTN|nr:hypothetical protein [Nonomuraea longispora]TDC02091.1 hypothetical protein E1267_30185 [Nonomuraea longispora]